MEDKPHKKHSGKRVRSQMGEVVPCARVGGDRAGPEQKRKKKRRESM